MPVSRGVTFAAICIVGLGIWCLRNDVRANYQGFAAIQSVNILYFRAVAVIAASEGIDFGLEIRDSYENTGHDRRDLFRIPASK